MQYKKIFWILTFSLLLTQLVNAQDLTKITLYDEKYLPGETIQLEIVTNNPERPISTTNIVFLDENKQKINVAPFLLKKDKNHYFLYFDLPLSLKQGNYSIEIQKLPYIIDNQLKEITTSQTIIIEEKNLPILSISPGFIVLEEGKRAFNLKIKNKKITTEIEINTTKDTHNVYIMPQIVQEGTERLFKFNLYEIKKKETNTHIYLKYGNQSYLIPVFFKSEEIEIKEEEKAIEFITDLKSVNKTIDKKKTLAGTLDFKNILNKALENIEIELTGNLNEIAKLDINHIDFLNTSEIKSIYVTVNEDKNPQKTEYSGNILIKAGNYSTTLLMYIKIEEGEKEPSKEELNLSKTTKTEPSKEPQIFPFKNKTKPAEKPEKKLNMGFLALIFILFILIVLFILFRRKKTVKKITFEEHLRSLER